MNETVRLRTRFRPLPHQIPALCADSGITFVVGGLGSGKSYAASQRLVTWALRNPYRKDKTPTKWLVLGKDYSLLVNEQMQYCLTRIEEIEGNLPLVKRVLRHPDPQIELVHGQTIHFRSGADPSRLRGHQYDGCWGDELEFMDAKAFTVALSRQRSADRIRFIGTTSPERVTSSWVWPMLTGEHEKFNEIRAKTPVRVFRWKSSDNKSNEAEVLSTIEAVLNAFSPNQARQELDGLFLGAEVMEAPAIEYAKAFVPTVRLTSALDATGAVLGVDLGRTEDFTWLVVLNRSGVVLAQDRFNITTPGVSRDRFYVYAEQRCLDLVSRFKIPLVKVDTALHGAAFADNLKQKLMGRARVDGFRTDASRRKSEAVEALAVALSNGQVRVPNSVVTPSGTAIQVQHVDQLRHEFSDLIVEDKYGYRTFNHRQGGHDDGVVALALAWQGLGRAPGARDLTGFFRPIPGMGYTT